MRTVWESEDGCRGHAWGNRGLGRRDVAAGVGPDDLIIQNKTSGRKRCQQ